MSSCRAAIVRILTTLHAALGRWLAQAGPPAAARKSTCSWFGFDAEAIHAALPTNLDEEVAERRRKNTFRIGQR
jgi:hypothetical protein